MGLGSAIEKSERARLVGASLRQDEERGEQREEAVFLSFGGGARAQQFQRAKWMLQKEG